MPNVSSRTHSLRLGVTSLSNGSHLPEVDVAYEQYGLLSAYGDNAILVCHALTGNARAAGEQGWWDPLIGPGAAFDTSKYAVFCSNILGSCYGTTGPASEDLLRGKPYGARFPRISIGDMVKVQRRWLERIGVKSLVTVAGGSLGGLQVVEWAAQAPEMLRSIMPMATGLSHSAWNIAFNEAARQAIRQDPNFHDGDYHSHGVVPAAGLSLARMIAMISYRSAASFEDRFARHVPATDEDSEGRYDVENYLHYQGRKLVERFDANCYMRITEAMDDFDVGHSRGGPSKALAGFRGPAFILSIDSDVLYPPWQQQQLADVLRTNGNELVSCEVRSLHGHDAFLMEWDQLDTSIRKFMKRFG
ncbi:MAG: homoserine O-acetyltransferase [Dehalococcoidia bacterium]|nr:homoserine O-acetyltransferase [Dehalococcoidia bacterium]